MVLEKNTLNSLVLLFKVIKSNQMICHTHNIQKQKRTQCVANVVQRVVPKEQMLCLWATL